MFSCRYRANLPGASLLRGWGHFGRTDWGFSAVVLRNSRNRTSGRTGIRSAESLTWVQAAALRLFASASTTVIAANTTTTTKTTETSAQQRCCCCAATTTTISSAPTQAPTIPLLRPPLPRRLPLLRLAVFTSQLASTTTITATLLLPMLLLNCCLHYTFWRMHELSQEIMRL